MARAGPSGSEPGADLSAWLAKIMARLSGSTAPSRAVYITTRKFPLPPSLIQSFIRDTEYHSAIFTHSPEQATTAQRVMEEIQAKYFTLKGKKIVTEIIPAGTWWDAEDYHQLYLFKNPSGYQCPSHKLH